MAKLLFDRGYRKVRPLLGGYDAWLEAGLPVGQTVQIRPPDAVNHG